MNKTYKVTTYPSVTFEEYRSPASVHVDARGFTSAEEVLNWQESYVSTYPWEGYGTSFKVSQDKETGLFNVFCSRMHSCD